MKLFFVDEHAVFQEGGEAPEGSITLSDSEYKSLLSQLSAGKKVVKSGDSYEVIAPKPDSNVVAAQVRAKRNTLLQQSDWTQVADAPANQAAWATYRQTLRDITMQSGFPENVVWPTPPN